jgi:hypothetical protein
MAFSDDPDLTATDMGAGNVEVSGAVMAAAAAGLRDTP